MREREYCPVMKAKILAYKLGQPLKKVMCCDGNPCQFTQPNDYTIVTNPEEIVINSEPEHPQIARYKRRVLLSLERNQSANPSL